MNKEFSCKGQFWLPGKKKKRVSGIINYSPKEGINVSLFGILDYDEKRDPKRFEVIFGEVYREGKITLFDVFETRITSSHIFTDKVSTSESGLVASHLLMGEWFKSKNITCNSIHLEVNNLHTWLGIHGFKSKFLKSGGISLTHKLPKEIYYKIDTIKRKIIFSRSISYPSIGSIAKDFELDEISLIKLESTENSKFVFFESIEIINQLVNFLTLVTDDTIFIEKLSFLIKTNEPKPFDEKKVRVYFHRSFWKEEKNPKYNWEMLFTYKDLKKNFSKYLNNWFKSYNQLQYIYDVYMGTIYHDYMFLYHTFLTRIQAIESYHRKKVGTTERPLKEFNQRLKIISSALKGNKKIKKWLLGKLKHSNEKGLKERIVEILKQNEDLYKVYITDFNKFAEKIC